MLEKRPKKIIYAYGEYQQLFEQMESSIPGLIFHHGLPTKEQIAEWTDPEEHTIIVLDDDTSDKKWRRAVFIYSNRSS